MANDLEEEVMSNIEGSPLKVVIVGAGTIGLSFASLHLRLAEQHPVQVTIFDTRPDIKEYVSATLPGYLDASSGNVEKLFQDNILVLASSLEDAVKQADVIQEQGPENLGFKQSIWAEIEKHAPKSCLFWSSTSGIPASQQAEKMQDKTRLVIVHPYNPPHIMPLLEVVPSSATDSKYVDQVFTFWRARNRSPVLINKEVPGFVANRLAWALWKEATALVSDGVISLEDLDELVTSSMGPRWAIAGPFKSYHVGGGAGGLQAFVNNIGGSVQHVWGELGQASVDKDLRECAQQADQVYGKVTAEDYKERDKKTWAVFRALGRA